MPKFIKLTDFGSGSPIYINVTVMFSIYRKPGTVCTMLKGAHIFEQVRESEAEILGLIGDPV